MYTDTDGLTKRLVQSGRYDVTLLCIDGEALSTRQVDNNLWYDQPDWNNYTAQGPQLNIIDDYTFMPCGSLLRQYKDSPLMKSHVLKTAILSNPCVLKNPSLHFGGYVPESQWMKEFNMVFGTMVNVAFFPAAMEVAGGILLKEAKDRLVKAAVASAIDGTLQSVCIYLEAEEGDDWQSLCGQYDVKQMMVSALEGAVDNVYTDLTVPLYDAFYKDGKPKENLDIASFLKDYGFGVTVNLLTRGATDGYFSKYYKRMVAAAKKGNLENKLAKIGLSAENRKAFIDLMGGMTQKSLQRFEALSQKLRTFPVDGTATDLSRFADELDAVADHYPKKSIDELVAAFGCFTAATPVATPEGVRPIADIETGDTVMSYNHAAQRTEPRVVANLKNYAAKALVILSLSTGQKIEATPTHPFHANGRYTPASELVPGDTLTSPNGHKVLLQDVQPLDTVVTVYNLTVAHNSNYFVGNPGVLVHNDCMMALLNAPIYKSLVDKLDKLTPELKAAFMADFEKAGKELLDVLNSPNGIVAWTMLNGLNYKLLKKNKQVLENLSQLLSNSAIDKSKLEQAIVNAYTSKLKGFGVDALLEALGTFKNTPGIGKLINDIGSEYGNFRKGAAFVLQKAKSLGADAVERFEEPIEIIVGKVRRYDMMLKGGKRVECKAWSNFYEGTIKKQFLDGDLCSVEKFEDIRYFVDESSMSLHTWFEHMSKFMKDNADEIWTNEKLKSACDLFIHRANDIGIELSSVKGFENFIVNNRSDWFDIIFKQDL